MSKVITQDVRTEFDMIVWDFTVKFARLENTESMFDDLSAAVHNAYDIMTAANGLEPVDHAVVSDFICQAWNAACQHKDYCFDEEILSNDPTAED